MEPEDSDRPGSTRRVYQRGEVRRRGVRGADPLEERVDRWVNRGRQLVEGVAGTRPGGRSGDSRSEARGGGDRRARPGLDGLGRWVESRLDWLLEDGDDWREPWEERPFPSAGPRGAGPTGAGPTPRRDAPPAASADSRSRRPLEAISRRGEAPRMPPAAESPAGSGDAWPEEDTFQIPRWQRGARPPGPSPTGPSPTGAGPPRSEEPAPVAAPPARALPRSSRRRP